MDELSDVELRLHCIELALKDPFLASEEEVIPQAREFYYFVTENEVKD